MNGDFTRDTYRGRNHYTRVLMQQGRVQLDADWNEQAAIGHERLRMLAADLIGPHGGPVNDCGFQLVGNPDLLENLKDDLGRPLRPERIKELTARMLDGDLLIGQGRYYVGGLMAQCDTWQTYGEQLGYPFDDGTTVDELQGARGALVYLDVWERHVSGAERADLLEVALGGVDTATRAELVWQVRVLRGDGPLDCADYRSLRRLSWPLLRARARQPKESMDACVIDPESRYRGAENQLYRVEIHRSGTVGDGATFVWSRENASVLFPVVRRSDDGTTVVVELETLGRDERSGLQPGDAVQLVDDVSTLRGGGSPILRVESIDRDEFTVVLAGDADDTGKRPELHPVLKRWDHKPDDPNTSDAGALLVKEASGAEDAWIELEDGVMVQFPASTVDGEPNEYRTGDYWLIPARTATGDVLWPVEEVDGVQVPRPKRPDGVEHRYAPLGVLEVGPDGRMEVSDCRLTFGGLAQP